MSKFVGIRKTKTSFEIPREFCSYDVVHLEVIVRNSIQTEFPRYTVRLQFETASTDGVSEVPITIRIDQPIFKSGSNAFDAGFFTFEKSGEFYHYSIYNGYSREMPDSYCPEAPIDFSLLRQLPYTVEHDIPTSYLQKMKRALKLEDGEEVILRLNAAPTRIGFWIPKSLEDIQKSKVFLYEGIETKKSWELAGHKVELGEDPDLLHWDITKAFCPMKVHLPPFVNPRRIYIRSPFSDDDDSSSSHD